MQHSLTQTFGPGDKFGWCCCTVCITVQPGNAMGVVLPTCTASSDYLEVAERKHVALHNTMTHRVLAFADMVSKAAP